VMGGDTVASSSKSICGMLRVDLARKVLLPGLRSTPATAGDTASSPPTGMGGAFALVFRMTRRPNLLTLVTNVVLPLATAFSLPVGLSLRPLCLAGLVLRRGAAAFLRMTRRTVRTAAFTAFLRRGLFVLIPDNDPCGGSRILSDAAHHTGKALRMQREFPSVFPPTNPANRVSRG